ncbi:MAG: hypothetical protein OEX07_05775, partial [Gammaproteobacteria bacterium]|nr:hypothetical protein [Gammaproteobacteria bacterium]
MKISSKIALYTILVIIFGSSVSQFFIHQTVIDQLKKNQNEWIETIAFTMTEGISKNTIDHNSGNAQRILSAIVEQDLAIEYAYIIDFDNHIFAHSFISGFPKTFAGNHQHLNDKDTLQRFIINGTSITDYYYPLIEGLNAHLHIGVNNREIEATTRKIYIKSTVILTLSITALIFTIILMSRKLGKPLEDLTAHIKNYQHGSLMSTIETEKFRGEALDLATAFN